MTVASIPPGPSAPYFSLAHARAGADGMPRFDSKTIAQGGVLVVGPHGDVDVGTLDRLMVTSTLAGVQIATGLTKAQAGQTFSLPANSEREFPGPWAQAVFVNPDALASAGTVAFRAVEVAAPGRLFSNVMRSHPWVGDVSVRLAAGGTWRDGASLEGQTKNYDLEAPWDVVIESMQLWSRVPATVGVGTVLLDVLVESAPRSGTFASIMTAPQSMTANAAKTYTTGGIDGGLTRRQRTAKRGARVRLRLSCGTTLNAFDLAAGLAYTVGE